jgi:hypothetical protein
MDVAHDLHAVPEVAIEDEVTADREMPHSGGDVVTGHSHLRVTGEQPAFLVEKIEKPIGR